MTQYRTWLKVVSTSSLVTKQPYTRGSARLTHTSIHPSRPQQWQRTTEHAEATSVSTMQHVPTRLRCTYGPIATAHNPRTMEDTRTPKQSWRLNTCGSLGYTLDRAAKDPLQTADRAAKINPSDDGIVRRVHGRLVSHTCHLPRPSSPPVGHVLLRQQPLSLF